MHKNNRLYANADRIAAQEVQNARRRKWEADARHTDPPTEKQLEYLSALEAVCIKNGIPCAREFELARRTNKGASGTIRKMRVLLAQRGIKWYE